MSTTQPSNVSTQDTPRPPDESVVTDENQTWQAEQEAASAAPAAAGESDKDGAGSKDDAAAASDQNQNEPTKKRDRASERRIKKLTKRLTAAEQREQERVRRITELEQENERLRSSQAAAPEPKLEDFKNPQEYAEAYADWKSKQASPGKKPATSSSSQSGDRQPANANAGGGEKAKAPEAELRKFQQRGQEKLGDEFLEALTDTTSVTPVNQVMGDYMLESDVGPEIYVYLYHHPDEATEIYDKSETAAVKRLEALAEKAKAGTLLDDEGTDAGAGDAGKGGGANDDAGGGKSGQQASGTGKSGSAPGNSRAPAPPNSGDDRGTAIVQKNPEDMSMDEYAEWRRKREQQH